MMSERKFLEPLDALAQIASLLPYLRWPEVNWLRARLEQVDGSRAYREWQDERRVPELLP